MAAASKKRGGGGEKPGLADAALELLAELESTRLDVVLVPAPDQRHSGHMIRVAQEGNCEWYRSLCDEYQSSRRRRSFKSDTKIKRAHTVRALERIIAGSYEGAYAERLMPYVEERLKEMYRHARRAHAHRPRATYYHDAVPF